MKNAALNLLGVLTGLTLGWIAVAVPLAAVFAPARVTWDATGCPAGIYTVTSTAQKIGTGEMFQATSTGIQLPRDTFAHDFANLPGGAYSVTANVTSNNGDVFSARSQAIQVAADPSTPNPGNPGQRGPAMGMPSAPGVVRPRTTQGSSGTVAASQVAGTRATPAASQPAMAGLAVAGPEGSVLEIGRLLDRAGAADWRRIEVIDMDGDGVIDGAAIEMAAGDIYILMIRRQ